MTFFVEGLQSSTREVTRVGEAETLDEAIAMAKRIVDEFLDRELRAGIAPEDLYPRYKDHGTVPCIFRDDGATMNVRTFNHFKYALAQCEKLCDDDPAGL